MTSQSHSHSLVKNPETSKVLWCGVGKAESGPHRTDSEYRLGIGAGNGESFSPCRRVASCGSATRRDSANPANQLGMPTRNRHRYLAAEPEQPSSVRPSLRLHSEPAYLVGTPGHAPALCVAVHRDLHFQSHRSPCRALPSRLHPIERRRPGVVLPGSPSGARRRRLGATSAAAAETLIEEEAAPPPPRRLGLYAVVLSA